MSKELIPKENRNIEAEREFLAKALGFYHENKIYFAAQVLEDLKQDSFFKHCYFEGCDFRHLNRTCRVTLIENTYVNCLFPDDFKP